MKRFALIALTLLLLTGCACTEDDDILRSITKEQQESTAP